MMAQELARKVLDNNGSDRRRDRHDIVAEILETARYGKIMTHIMYKAKLSYDQINKYLPLLVQIGFLENNDIVQKRKVKKIYKTTSKGLAFLENYEALNVF